MKNYLKSFTLKTLLQIELILLVIFSFILFNTDIAKNHLPYLNGFKGEQLEMMFMIIIGVYISVMTITISSAVLFIQITLKNTTAPVYKVKFILKSNLVCSVIIICLLIITIPLDTPIVDSVTNEPIVVPNIVYILAIEVMILSIITYRTFSRMYNEFISGGDLSE